MIVDLLIVGIAVGALYGLLALSVSLIYASLDIIQFAQGEIFTLGAFLGWVAYTRRMPFAVALLLGPSEHVLWRFLSRRWSTIPY